MDMFTGEIAQLALLGFTSGTIASRLGLEPSSVRAVLSQQARQAENGEWEPAIKPVATEITEAPKPMGDIIVRRNAAKRVAAQVKREKALALLAEANAVLKPPFPPKM